MYVKLLVFDHIYKLMFQLAVLPAYLYDPAPPGRGQERGGGPASLHGADAVQKSRAVDQKCGSLFQGTILYTYFISTLKPEH